MTTPDEVLKGLYDETLVGNAPRVLELTEEGLALGMEPQTLLFDALIPSLEEVGARFERGDFFVPEMLIAGRAMAGAMERLRPLLAEFVLLALLTGGLLTAAAALVFPELVFIAFVSHREILPHKAPIALGSEQSAASNRSALRASFATNR